jgi:hypothetical protein
MQFEGAWVNRESNSYLYARTIKGQLVAPYCYDGNDELTGVYYGWARAGEYWFTRFLWIDGHFSGFAFLKQVGRDRLVGAWWLDEDATAIPDGPPEKAGVPVTLDRLRGAPMPKWAADLLHDAREGDLLARLATR